VQRNIAELQRDPATFVRTFLHSSPTALFVLVPVFALLLKLFYVRSGRGYLEHLIVALYSQSFLMLVLLASFLLLIVVNQWPATGYVSGWLQILLWLWMAVYLWLTQYRVYAQGVVKTSLKYIVLGSIYFWLMMLAVPVLVFLRLLYG
jgi:small-conductance mechanosensitive channel